MEPFLEDPKSSAHALLVLQNTVRTAKHKVVCQAVLASKLCEPIWSDAKARLEALSSPSSPCPISRPSSAASQPLPPPPLGPLPRLSERLGLSGGRASQKNSRP